MAKGTASGTARGRARGGSQRAGRPAASLSKRVAAVAAASVVAAGVVTVRAAINGVDAPATAVAPAARLGTTIPTPPSTNRSLRFFGTGTGGIDRVRIPLSGGTAVNVGAGDFTIEFWIKGLTADNAATGCTSANDAWINGNIAIDRDVYGDGDFGDFGISLFAGRVAFGASASGSGATVCGNTDVLDGAWHHLAVTRAAVNGQMRIFVDGALDAQNASSPAAGDIAYRVGRSTAQAADPTLVLGAEKHDAGSSYPSFAGWLDEVRVSTVLRYTAAFARPSSRFSVDGATAALYHLDEGSGTAVADAAGTSPGTRMVGGAQGGPQWSNDVPFA